MLARLWNGPGLVQNVDAPLPFDCKSTFWPCRKTMSPLHGLGLSVAPVARSRQSTPVRVSVVPCGAAPPVPDEVLAPPDPLELVVAPPPEPVVAPLVTVVPSVVEPVFPPAPEVLSPPHAAAE